MEGTGQEDGEAHSDLTRREGTVLGLMKGVALVGAAIYILGGLVLFTLWSKDQWRNL